MSASDKAAAVLSLFMLAAGGVWLIAYAYRVLGVYARAYLHARATLAACDLVDDGIDIALDGPRRTWEGR